MMNSFGAAAVSQRMLWARRIGYAACSWALVFSLLHLYRGIEVATGTLTVPGGAIPTVSNDYGPAGGGNAIESGSARSCDRL